jgi:hypothetical protein
MLNILPALFLGWPAIIATVILSALGLFRRDYRFLVVAAILAVPFSWVLSGFPLIRSPFFLVPVLPFSAAFALQRDHEMIAWILGVIYFLSVYLIFTAVLAGNA